MAAAVSAPPIVPDAKPSQDLDQDQGDPSNPSRTTNHPPEADPTPPHSPKSEPLSLTSLSPPSFFDSIAELKDISDAIAAFHHTYEDLRNHLDSIKDSIVSLLPHETPAIAPSSSANTPLVPEEKALQKQSEQYFRNPDLEDLCKTMCSRGVRKHLVTHLSNLPKLREEVPKALRLAPNPPKIVLECLGKFFLQGSKAFTRDSPMIPAREASILILECFLLMMGIDADAAESICIEKEIQEEAADAALAWRKRLLMEGGLAQASVIDGRGLLFFVACFGIPSSFKREDIRDLLVAANSEKEEVVTLLKKSPLLMNKLPEILEGMIQNKMEVDAVDLAYTFGLTEKFNPQTILTTLLRESKEAGKKPKKVPQASAATNNEANKKHLAALKSITKCLERHNLDPAKILPGWQINEKLTSLEKEIAESDKKTGEQTAIKRKASDPEPSKKLKNQEAKRARYTTPGPKRHKPIGHNDNRRNFTDNIHAKTYSAPPTVIYGGPGAVFPHGLSAANHGIHQGVVVDASPAPLLNPAHILHRESAINERYAAPQPTSVALNGLYRAPPPSVEGFAGAPNISSVRGTAPADLYQFADSIAESVSRGAGAGAAVSSAVPAYFYPR
ncbi:protein FRIGIDA [Andrographis paniculata]|uniref:protein FRIGIDA n=1 Tax=Andrographis paniculata TaxID=175694 RepID=UPI0021E8580F|nr:protein FRIGIDA [Andrographis paniculata]